MGFIISFFYEGAELLSSMWKYIENCTHIFNSVVKLWHGTFVFLAIWPSWSPIHFHVTAEYFSCVKNKLFFAVVWSYFIKTNCHVILRIISVYPIFVWMLNLLWIYLTCVCLSFQLFIWYVISFLCLEPYHRIIVSPCYYSAVSALLIGAFWHNY